jgi:hypothetical protein
MTRTWPLTFTLGVLIVLSGRVAAAQEPAEDRPPPPANVHASGATGQTGVGVSEPPAALQSGDGGAADGSCVGMYCSPLIDEFAAINCALGLDDWCWEDAEPALPPAITVAQLALDSAEFSIPAPQLSPPDRQITGLRTWFWMDPGEWQPTTAHAEIPGLWASVTVTPTTARWTPGDGGATVTCGGPGRPHPGTEGARTDCGHVYTDAGDYALTVEVTYAVSWTSSTGEGGTLDPVTLTAGLDVHVEQRQAVTS